MKKKMKIAWIFLCMIVLICSAFTVAEATTVDFEIGAGNYIDFNPAELSISLNMYDPPAGVFPLSEGESYTFDYAEIISITVNDDTTDTFSVTAYLDFVLPDVGVINNTGDVTVKVKGHCKMGVDNLNIHFDPRTVYFGDEGEFTLQISELSLSPGSSGKCCFKPTGAGALTAKVTLEAAPVPEPGTLVLLGSGLVGVAFYARRRKV